MKRFILGAAAIAAIATPAALADTRGHVDLTYENTSFDPGSEFNVVALGGAVTTDLGGGWNVQFDGATNRQDWDGSSSADSLGYAAVHAFMRNDSYAVGGYAGLTSYYDDSVTMVGLEAQKYFSNFTLNGAVSYGNEDTGGTDTDAWRANAGGKYFFSPNLAVGADVGYTSFDSFTEYDGWDLGANVEYQFAGSPVSLFGGYTHTSMDHSSGGDYDIDSWNVGLRIDLSGQDVQSRENSGASLSGAKSFFTQWTRW